MIINEDNHELLVSFSGSVTNKKFDCGFDVKCHTTNNTANIEEFYIKSDIAAGNDLVCPFCGEYVMKHEEGDN